MQLTVYSNARRRDAAQPLSDNMLKLRARNIEKSSRKFLQRIRGSSNISPRDADVAQLVEHDLAKVGVAGSNPVVRSKFTSRLRAAFFMLPLRSRVPCPHVVPLARRSIISPPEHRAIQSQRPVAMNSIAAASQPFDANKHPPRLPDPGFG